MPHSCWLAGSPSPTKTDRMQGRVVLGQVGPLSANHFSLLFLSTAGLDHLRRGAASHGAGSISSLEGSPLRLWRESFSSSPPGTYGRIKTAAGGQVYVQDTKRMRFPINPSHHLFGEYRSASWVNISNRLNISATHPSADLDISQSHANQIPKSLASPHCKDHPPSRFAELQGAPDLGGGW